MKVIKSINEDDVIYGAEDVVELGEDIDYLIDNKPKGIRKGSSKYKEWLREIEDRMKLYNEYSGQIAFVKKYTE